MTDIIQSELEKEIDAARRTIKTDSYPMSIGELTNLYRDGELVISPQFQRLFRWSNEQKSKLVESILIGIPLPSIFVSQNDAGHWELVDGLQRVSTLLQLQGLLNEDEYPQLVLSATKYLPTLDGAVWDSDDPDAKTLSSAQRLDIKRSKVDIKIIQRSSDSKTKFDLFQRLNSFGSKLSNQEIRHAQLVGISPGFADWIVNLSQYEPFVELTSLSEKNLVEKYDSELVLRLLFLSSKTSEEIRKIASFQDELEDYSTDLAGKFDEDRSHFSLLEKVFKDTFDILIKSDSGILKKWDETSGKFKGGFSNTSYELLAIGVANLLLNEIPIESDVVDVSKRFWKGSVRYATGRSTETRIKDVVPRGRDLLSSGSARGQN